MKKILTVFVIVFGLMFVGGCARVEDDGEHTIKRRGGYNEELKENIPPYEFDSLLPYKLGDEIYLKPDKKEAVIVEHDGWVFLKETWKDRKCVKREFSEFSHEFKYKVRYVVTKQQERVASENYETLWVNWREIDSLKSKQISPETIKKEGEKK